MIIAKLSYEGRPDRYVQLEDGVHVFGADLYCDVVLVDDFIQPKHFSVECGPTGAKIQILDGAAAVLNSVSAGELELDAGSEATWHFSDRLMIAGLTIALSGDVLSPPEPSALAIAPQPRLVRFFNRSVRGALMVTAAGMICGMAYMVLTRGFAGPVEARGVEPGQQTVEQLIATPIALPTKEAIIEALTTAGFAPDYIRPAGTGYSAGFYVSSVTKRAELQLFLAGFEVSIEARIFLDSSLLSAANMALDMGGKNIGGHSVKNGILLVENAPVDTDWRESLKMIINTDVPGLKAVEFVGSDKAWQEELSKLVAGAWAGRYPYVVLSDGSDVRIGQDLMPNVALLGIEAPGTLLLNINGNPEEYKLP